MSLLKFIVLVYVILGQVLNSFPMVNAQNVSIENCKSVALIDWSLLRILWAESVKVTSVL